LAVLLAADVCLNGQGPAALQLQLLNHLLRLGGIHINNWQRQQQQQQQQQQVTVSPCGTTRGTVVSKDALHCSQVGYTLW
jgi:hypothetical protein